MMSHFTYENQGGDALLVYHLGEEEHLDSFAKGMLQENRMENILPPAYAKRDKEQYLKYPVTSRLPLREYLSGEIGRETCLKLCMSVAAALRELEEYSLEADKLVLDPDYIFVDVRKRRAELIYVPVDEFGQQDSPAEFLRSMVSHMCFRGDEELSYVGKLLYFLNQQETWTYEDLEHHIEGLLKGSSGREHSSDGAAAGGGTLKKERMMRGYPEATKESAVEPTPVAAQAVSGISTPERASAFAQGTSVPVQGMPVPAQGAAAPGLASMPASIPGFPMPGTGAMSIPAPVSGAVPVPPEVLGGTAEKKGGLFGRKAKKENNPDSGKETKKERKEREKRERELQKEQHKAEKKGLFGVGKKKEIREPVIPVIQPQPDLPPLPLIPGQVPQPSVPLIPGQETTPLASGRRPLPPIPGQESIPSAFSHPSLPPVQNHAPTPSAPGWQPSPSIPPQPPKPLSGQAAPQLRPSPIQMESGENTVYAGGGSSEDGEGTVILGGGEESSATVILGASDSETGRGAGKDSGQQGAGRGKSRPSARLRCRRTGQSMEIRRGSLRIGSEGSFVDFYISDNQAIGGCHADISEKDGVWYITDRNSANHTYVNGAVLPPMQAVPILDGAAIRLADEEFEFTVHG